jgi:membrane protein
MIQPYLGDNKHIADMVLGWSLNVVGQTRKGLFGIVSFLAFIWIVIWLMISIEDTFNHIWCVKRSRNFFKSLGIYLLILILIPFLLLIFLYGAGYYTSVISELSKYKVIDFFASRSYWLIFYGAALLVFSLMYKFIPHTKVRFRDCVKAAIWTALAFVLLQYIYLETQMMVTRMNGVYGAFAAIPLMMIWLNYSWQIILFGVYLTYSYEHVDDFDPEKDELFSRYRERRQKRIDSRRKAVSERKVKEKDKQ